MLAAWHQKFLIALILSALFGPISGQVQPRVPANFSVQVNGVVRYANNRRPAENVLVRIESFSGGLISQAMTDRGGKFSFTGLTAMQYIVTTHAPGFQDARQNVDLLTSNTSYLNIDLIEARDTSSSNSPTPGVNVVDANIPYVAQTEYAKGKAALQSNDPNGRKNAVRNFENAVRIYPQYLEAQLMLGITYMDLHEWAKAETALKKAIEINSNAATAYIALSDTYIEEGKYPMAEEAAISGLKVEPKSAQGHLALAKANWQGAPSAADENGFRTKAEKAWKEVSLALTLDPNLADAHVLAGNMLLRARRGKEALVHFETYLKLEPEGRLAAEVRPLVKKLTESLPQADQ